MKNKQFPHRGWIRSGLMAGLAVACSLTIARGQTIITSYTNTFGTAGKAASWHHWYDINAPTYNGPLMDWDTNWNNTIGQVGSGSIVYSNTWPGHAAGVNNQGQDVFYGTFGESGIFDTSQSIDATKYDSISFDLHADASCPTNANGDICTLQVGTFHSYSFFVVTNLPISTSTTNGWTHYVCPINKATIPTSLCQGICFNINCYGGANAALINGTNTTKFWIDNLLATRSKEALPPPKMTTVKNANQGLNLFSFSASSDQYQRTNIKLQDGTGASWVGQTGDSTYSLTISSFPPATQFPGYQAHIFITTGSGNNSGLDYADPNLIFLDIKQNVNGTANAVFRYKTNQPNGNSMVYGAGTLGNCGSSTILGTWSVTFNQDTNIIVRSPDGTTFTTNITQDAANLFAGPVNVAFGAQPNNAASIGQAVVLSSAAITNGGNVIYDNFLADTSLDTGLWQPLSATANSVQLFPADSGAKLVSWTLPDTGYGLQTSTNVVNPASWKTLSGNEYLGTPLISYASGGQRTALVPAAELGPDANYFRMFTRKFTKLQVLLPGETADPGSPTGKTGTPDAQAVGVPFSVVVNAVNNNWYLAATGDDTIHLTSTDGTATLPADFGLSGGTATVSVTLNAAGTFTITGSDVSDGTKTPSTSASVTVN